MTEWRRLPKLVLLEWADLKDSVRVDEVIDALGIRITHITKGEYFASCPLPSHPGADRKPSFSINELGLVWHCFTCGEGGLLPKLVMQIEGMEWEEAIEWLVEFSDEDPRADDAWVKQVRRYLERPVSPPAASRRVSLPYFSPRVLEGLRMAPVSLVEKWHVRHESTILDFDLRFDPERTRQGHTESFIGPALIIPHRFEGDLVGWQERWPDERPDWLPKYTNTDDFPRRHTLFNYDYCLIAARHGETPIIVESVTTVIRLHELGLNAMATFGASVTDEQIRLLRGFRNGLILAQDNDPDVFKNGKWIKGAGLKNLKTMITRLDNYVPVEVIPPVSVSKGDLADVSDEEVLRLYAAREPSFSVFPSP